MKRIEQIEQLFKDVNNILKNDPSNPDVALTLLKTIGLAMRGELATPSGQSI